MLFEVNPISKHHHAIEPRRGPEKNHRRREMFGEVGQIRRAAVLIVRPV